MATKTISKNTSFTVIVTKAPYDSRNAESAIRFCCSVLKKGYKIDQVFFYSAGVHCASSLVSPPIDEMNVYTEWVNLHEKYGITLNVCNTAGVRRGVVNDESSSSGMVNVERPFVMTGLSDYFSALASGSKNIQF